MADRGIGPIVGVILAGGRAERMGGGDKCLARLAGGTILERVIARLRPQVADLALNANGDPARFAAFGLPVIPDAIPGFAGPLAGVLAGLEWAAARRPPARYVVSVPGDGPFLPRDLVHRLAQVLVAEDAELATAAGGRQIYPVVGLWPAALAPVLREALAREGIRKVDAWTGRFRRAIVTYDAQPVDPFFNANTPADLAEAERLAALHPDI